MRTLVAVSTLSLAIVCGCSSTHTVLVSVPPRVDVKSYGTVGIVEFASSGGSAIGARAARRLEEEVQAAQPGTRFIELGEPQAVLAAVGSSQFDFAAAKKIGEKYGVGAVFVGEIAYSEPKMDIRVIDVAKLEGNVRAEMRGDVSSRLIETASGANVWSSSAWAHRQLGSLSVSAERGVNGGMAESNPQEAMLPSMVYQLTRDFRPTTMRQTVQQGQ
jgi:hypothetical protein